MNSATARAIQLLQNSHDSAYTHASVDEIIAALQAIQRGEEDQARLRLFFAPTGPIQEIAMDNGWGNEFLRLAKEIDVSGL